MINLHESMGLNRDQTSDSWVCSQACYQLCYAAWSSLINTYPLTSIGILRIISSSNLYNQQYQLYFFFHMQELQVGVERTMKAVQNPMSLVSIQMYHATLSGYIQNYSMITEHSSHNEA